MLRLFESDITDVPIQRSFREVINFVNTQPFLLGEWRHMEVIIPGARTNYKVEHQLSFTPKDLILTYQSVNGALTINYANITNTYLDFTSTGGLTIRFFVGRYTGG